MRKKSRIESQQSRGRKQSEEKSFSRAKNFVRDNRREEFSRPASKNSNGERKTSLDTRSLISGSRLPSPDPRQSAVIFGLLPVLESLKSGSRRIEKILIADGARERRLNEVLDLARQTGVPFQKIPRGDFSRYVQPDANHQGVVALTAAADYANAEELINEILSKENPLAIILDGVEDPRNLGAILRTAECAGADGVFIPERRAVGLTETVAKTSAGAIEYVKIAKVTNIARLVDELKENGVWTIGTSADAKMNYTDWDWTQKSALVLGGEGAGLHRLVAEKCDQLVKIPLLGRIESLNVSVVAGVILYEAVRQRREKLRMTNNELRETKDEERRTKD